MKLPSTTYIVIGAVLLACNLLLVGKIILQRQQFNDQLTELDGKITYQLALVEDIQDAFLMQFQSGDRAPYRNVSLVNDKNDSVSLGTLMDAGAYKVVFRIFSGNCDPCIESQLMDLIELSRTIGSDKIAVISNYDADGITLLRQKFNMQYDLFSLRDPAETLGLPIDTLQVPYYFLHQANTKPVRIFPVVGNLKNHTNIFFDEVKRLAL